MNVLHRSSPPSGQYQECWYSLLDSVECYREFTSYVFCIMWFDCRVVYLQGSYGLLATRPGNLPAVRLLTSGSIQFSLRTGQKPDPLCLAEVVTRTGHELTVYWPGWNRTGDPLCGSFFFGTALGAIEYLSSVHIVTWSVQRLYSARCLFTASFQKCDPTDPRWLAIQYVSILCEIRTFWNLTWRILVVSPIW